MKFLFLQVSVMPISYRCWATQLGKQEKQRRPSFFRAMVSFARKKFFINLLVFFVMVSSRTYKAFGIIIVKTVEKTGTILVGTGITYQVAFHYSILSAGQKFREK